VATIDHTDDDDAEEISFFEHSQNYCVCFVGMTDPTKFIAQIKDFQIVAKYYSVFLNSMSSIVRNFGGRIIKNVADSLFYYFPETSNDENRSAFKNMLECCITMMAGFKVVNLKMSEFGVMQSVISYRISADYGSCCIAKSAASQSFDLFGPTINICAKINSKAPPNGMIIGNNLYQVLRSFPSSFLNDYYFKSAGEYSVIGLKQSYPVYSVVSKYKNENDKDNYYNNIIQNYETISQQEQEEQEKQKMGSQKNILLVDDEPDLAFTYKSMLKDEGYDNVDTFIDPQLALKHFAQLDPYYYNLVLLDVRMPNLNGLQFYYRIKSINPNIKIIFVTALDIVDELATVLPDFSPDKDIIKKPVMREHYISKVQTALSS
jgi:two-component system, OmpR family, response regulator ChvI